MKEELKINKNEMILKYKIENTGKFRIFGKKFVDCYKRKVKIEINGKAKKLKKFYDNETSNIEEIEVKLIGIDKITDMKYMFCGCSSLLSLPDISNWDTSKVTDMKYMFNGCSSLLSLPDISKWDTSKVTDMKHMFDGCCSLSSLPDISKWDTS